MIDKEALVPPYKIMKKIFKKEFENILFNKRKKLLQNRHIERRCVRLYRIEALRGNAIFKCPT